MEQIKWKEENARRAQMASNGVSQPPPSQPVYHPNHQVGIATFQVTNILIYPINCAASVYD
jgi:hypothetical protein